MARPAAAPYLWAAGRGRYCPQIAQIPQIEMMLRECGMAMTKGERIGCIAAIVIGAFLAWCFFDAYIAPAFTSGERGQSIKNRGRGIWIAVVSANSERETLVNGLVWPKELGFDHRHTSTEYFRWLKSDTPGHIATNAADQYVSDLSANLLGMDYRGIPTASSAATFSSSNNAWIVICVSNDSPSDVPFLITRNVFLGQTACATSTITRVKSAFHPQLDYVIWVTRGGGCFLADFKYLTPAMLFPHTNETYDVMYP